VREKSGSDSEELDDEPCFRPVAVGNLLHFSILAASLLRSMTRGHPQAILLVAAFVYSVLAAWFALVVFKNPLPKEAVSAS
jgi:hypothetical protein